MAPHRQQFIMAMEKEVADQLGNKKFLIIHHQSKVPGGATILPTVWHLKRKPDIKTEKVKKWKAQLNIDGSRMEKGCHYWGDICTSSLLAIDLATADYDSSAQ